MIRFPLAVPGMDPIETALDARLDRTHPCWPVRHRVSFRSELLARADLSAGLAGDLEIFKGWTPVKWREEWKA